MGFYDHLEATDPEIAAIIRREERRQFEGIELIASENYISTAVAQTMANIMTNKYAEGLPGKRYYGGCEFIDEAENLAIDRAKRLFGAEHANVQPHSGAQANAAVYLALLQPGDTVLGMALDQGGHLTHGAKVNFSGKLYNFVPYGVSRETETIDYDALEALAREQKPRMIVAGFSAYPRRLDFARFRQIADAVGAYLMADVAHVAGLIAAGSTLIRSPIATLSLRPHIKRCAVRAARSSSAPPSSPRRSTRASSRARRAARWSTSSRPRPSLSKRR